MFGEMSIRIQEGKQRAGYSNGYKAKHVSRHSSTRYIDIYAIKVISFCFISNFRQMQLHLRLMQVDDYRLVGNTMTRNGVYREILRLIRLSGTFVSDYTEKRKVAECFIQLGERKKHI